MTTEEQIDQNDLPTQDQVQESEFFSLVEKDHDLILLINQCEDKLKLIKGAKVYPNDENRTVTEIKPLWMAAKRLKTSAGNIASTLEKRFKITLNKNELMDDFNHYEIDLPALQLNLLGDITTNMLKQLRFNQEKIEQIYRSCFDEFKQKITCLQKNFDNSCFGEKSKLELNLDRRTSDVWTSTHVTDHANLQGVVINQESNCIFHIIPGLQYAGKGGNWISSSEFQKQALIHEGVSSLKFQITEDSDQFYSTVREKGLGRVYTFPSTNDFHKQVVEKFALSNKDSTNLMTVFEGVIINGRCHGRGRIMVHDGGSVYIFALVTLNAGNLEGICTYITSDKFMWLRTSFSKGEKSGIEIEV